MKETWSGCSNPFPTTLLMPPLLLWCDVVSRLYRLLLGLGLGRENRALLRVAHDLTL